MSSSQQRTILIIGAIEKEGSSVVRAMVKEPRADFSLRALVSNPSEEACLKLKEQGIELVKGDLNDEASLRSAMSGVHGVFAVKPFQHGSKKDSADVEEKQLKTVATIAAEVGVQHLVYLSTCGANNASELPHSTAKWNVEQHINKLGESKNLPWTILRPAALMEMCGNRFMTPLVLSAMRAHMSPERKFQMIATDDIGNFVRLVFERRDEFLGKTISLAGDELTKDEISAVVAEVNGNGAPWVPPIPQLVFKWTMYELHLMFSWVERVGYDANVAEVRKMFPALRDYKTFLTERKNQGIVDTEPVDKKQFFEKTGVAG